MSIVSLQIEVQIRTQLNANKSGSGQCRSRGGDKIGHNGNNKKFRTPHQRYGNCEHIKMLSFISCK
jgi:hypothetical protein